MKKHFLPLLCFGLTLSLSAQTAYYQKKYFFNRSDIMTAATQLGTSNIMLGTGFDITLNSNVVNLARSTAAGSIAQSGTSFAASYEMRLGTQLMPVEPRDVIAPGATVTTPTSVITAAGNYTSAQGCFVLTTNIDGTVRSAKHIRTDFIVNEFRVTTVTGGSSTINNQFVTNQVYVIGYMDITSASGEQGVATFVMAMNSVTNTVLWFRIYNLDSFSGTTAEREEPTASCINSNHLVIAGNASTTAIAAPGNQRGFVIRIDQSTGNIVGSPVMINFVRPSLITGMDQSNTYSNSLLQVNLCGTTTDITNPGPGINDAWAASVNTAVPSVAWSQQFDYSNGGNNSAVSIINRIGFLLVAGNVDNGSVGNDFDVSVLRLNPNDGTPMYEATYGLPGEDYATDIRHNFGQTGFSLFGSNVTNSRVNFSGISAYYNGLSGCNEAFAMPVVIPFSMTMSNTTSTVITGTVTTQTMNVVSRIGGRTTTNCSSTSLPGGINTRLANPNPEPDDENEPLKLFPNPASAADVVNLQWHNAAPGITTVDIYDLTGRQVAHQQFDLASGNRQAELPLSGLKPGTYLLILNEDGITRNTRFTVIE